MPRSTTGRLEWFLARRSPSSPPAHTEQAHLHGTTPPPPSLPPCPSRTPLLDVPMVLVDKTVRIMLGCRVTVILVPLAERLALMVGILSKDNQHVHTLLLDNTNRFADDVVTLINTLIPWCVPMPPALPAAHHQWSDDRSCER